MREFCTFIANVFNSELFIAIAISTVAILSGIWTYFKQKEYELVHKRYLIDGIDLVCNNIDYSLGIFKNNWARSIQLLHQFRDVHNLMKKEDYTTPFIKFDYKRTEIVPFSRLDILLNNNLFYNLTQLLWAFTDNAYTFFEKDLRKAISSYIELNKNDVQLKKDICDSYLEEIVDLQKQSKRYYLIIEYLLKISSILERDKFSFKNLNKFKDRIDVQNIINDLKNDFGELPKLENWFE